MSEQTASRGGRVALVVLAVVLDVIFTVLSVTLYQVIDQPTAWITVVILGLVILFINIMLFMMATSTKDTGQQDDTVSSLAAPAPQVAPAKNPGQAVIVIALAMLGKWLLFRFLDRQTTLR